MNRKYLQIFKSTDHNTLLHLLKENVIGTPHYGMLYQQLEVKKKLRAMLNPYYVNLIKKKSIGSYLLFLQQNHFE